MVLKKNVMYFRQFLRPEEGSLLRAEDLVLVYKSAAALLPQPLMKQAGFSFSYEIYRQCFWIHLTSVIKAQRKPLWNAEI